eukprot:CAMPEP_0119375108 /NCGR_PEP_ID=MMETSP1334-20130426/33777_1 /TAXON_ID=127549 /ORGANISM="Calcidiscus leptoporus, Strain RCC1130" /LENGTH=147 /DNA_ID=CAMNT_0007393329 /DNA_START=338 /DNA_END=777 /DNA_ORIENTATION=+
MTLILYGDLSRKTTGLKEFLSRVSVDCSTQELTSELGGRGDRFSTRRGPSTHMLFACGPWPTSLTEPTSHQARLWPVLCSDAYELMDLSPSLLSVSSRLSTRSLSCSLPRPLPLPLRLYPLSSVSLAKSSANGRSLPTVASEKATPP